MKQLFSFTFILIFSLQGVKAQVPFAQVNQIPLLLNPSLAGAKESKRLSMGYNVLGSAFRQGHNIAISYDQVWKKMGSGIGIYFLNSSNKKDQLSPFFNNYIPKEARGNSFINIQELNFAGVCFAPKYNIRSKGNVNKISYTFSPSVFLEYGKSTFSDIGQIKLIAHQGTFYSSAVPDGQPIALAATSQSAVSKTQTNILRYGFGLQLNSGKVLLLLKVPFERAAAKEEIDLVQFDPQNNSEIHSQNHLQHVLFSVEPTLHAGYSFSKTPESDFSFTPLLGIGMKHYFNLGQKYEGSNGSGIYSAYLLYGTSRQLNYMHASLNFRYRKILFGHSFTLYDPSIYRGALIGFQNKRIKITSNVGFAIGGYGSNKYNVEIAMGLLF